MGYLSEIQLETPKEMSLAYLSADPMAMKMVLLSDYCWVYSMEKSSEKLMEMRMAMCLAYLSAVLKAMQMVEMKVKRLVQQRDLCLVQPKELLKATSLV